MNRSTIRSIVIIWFVWLLLVTGFQALVEARYQPARPDRALFWTPTETTATAQDDKPYLIEPFMNRHVAWDSEYYISIALAGYDDPISRGVQVEGQVQNVPIYAARYTQSIGDQISLNYAFMPFYPTVIRVVSWPLRLFMEPIAAATLAGVLVSAVGALVGMLALADITHDELGDSGGIRAAFYLIIFPTGFFLAQVYTEGLFVGLAFASLALMKREQWVAAAVLAVLATWTRAVGVALVIPMIWPWFQNNDWIDLDLEWRELYFRGIPWRAIGIFLVRLSPLVAFLLWRFSFNGLAFSIVEDLFFGRGAFILGTSFANWINAVQSLWGDNSQAAAYYVIELAAIVLGITACVATWRKYPALSLYGLVVVIIALTSGPAQGMHRYILAAPSVFIFLSRLGRSPAFDRSWTIASLLIMGLLATLFTFNFWVA